MTILQKEMQNGCVLFMNLGLSVGVIYSGQELSEKAAAYTAMSYMPQIMA